MAPGSSTRWRWIHLIKELGYEARMFETAAVLLARFLASEPLDHKQNSAREFFAGWFHLHLSGTQATPEQRRAVVRRLANSDDSDLRRCVLVSLEALLNTFGFISIGSSGFGARSRGWGWQPASRKKSTIGVLMRSTLPLNWHLRTPRGSAKCLPTMPEAFGSAIAAGMRLTVPHPNS